MKVNIELDRVKEFTPFNLIIRIETIGELMNMYQRFTNDSIIDLPTSIDKEVGMGGMNCYRIWELLNARLVVEREKS